MNDLMGNGILSTIFFYYADKKVGHLISSHEMNGNIYFAKISHDFKDLILCWNPHIRTAVKKTVKSRQEIDIVFFLSSFFPSKKSWHGYWMALKYWIRFGLFSINLNYFILLKCQSNPSRKEISQSKIVGR